MKAVFFALLIGLMSLFPASAEEFVDVELVLAADGSGSIDDDELALQRRGYADAVMSSEVLDVIRNGIHGAIAVAYIEWGGPSSQHVIVDWHRISDLASAKIFADKLVAAPRQASGYNSISEAIAFSTAQIQNNTYAGLKRVIDVSGDGPQIGGRPLSLMRQNAINQGITINGLVIKRPGGGYRGPLGEPLEEHYANDVIGGPGAFVMSADETTSFAQAVRSKMVLEIASKTPNTPSSVAMTRKLAQ